MVEKSSTIYSHQYQRKVHHVSSKQVQEYIFVNTEGLSITSLSQVYLIPPTEGGGVTGEGVTGCKLLSFFIHQQYILEQIKF